MAPGTEDADALQRHVSHLRYAVATTTCRKTVEALRDILRDAEERLRSSSQRLKWMRLPMGNPSPAEPARAGARAQRAIKPPVANSRHVSPGSPKATETQKQATQTQQPFRRQLAVTNLPPGDRFVEDPLRP